MKDKMKTFAIDNAWRDDTYREYGWGNGYVAIPVGHPLHGKSDNEIHDLMPDLDVNGGLTFSRIARDFKRTPDDIDPESWIVGFDTGHIWDSTILWPNEASVLAEAECLKNQLQNYKP